MLALIERPAVPNARIFEIAEGAERTHSAATHDSVQPVGGAVGKKPAARSLYRDGAGSVALIAGIVAVVCAFVPFIGDYLAIPAGLVAVVCGWVGLSRAVDGTATNGREAMIGAALGGTALFVVFLMFAASYM
ncbi:hypothetical protein CH282_01245 [Rhodococcus sp. 06-418-1B]|nr:hypothetical protein [Rhodococcus sp. 06-418-1B]OZC92929.1 hypothetical protein CH282_01245 [Rhodococcus sp. 06-418-1B]